ncbi:hypothetical protein [Saccharothrix sp. ST-888]|uniref:hypothetical protein n=1 Tax=Saccharothrix sp. ST-888 TaxID=1427391 RepID=UPI000A56DB02|nr:hypothetical protein [Saccharothrix sp. ST-888]
MRSGTACRIVLERYEELALRWYVPRLLLTPGGLLPTCLLAKVSKLGVAAG